MTREQIGTAPVETAVPAIGSEALDGLKFSAALGAEMARATLAERFVERGPWLDAPERLQGDQSDSRTIR